MRSLSMFVFVVGAGAVLGSAGCAAPRQETPVGALHEPYPGKPEYLASPAERALGRELAKNPRRGNTAPIHLSAPLAPEAAEPAPVEAAPAAAQAEPEPVQPGGSLIVTQPEQAPLPNRVQEVPQPWQPQIVTTDTGPPAPQQ